MNLVIFILLLANVAGIYYGYYEHPPRPSQYPQTSERAFPKGAALLTSYQATDADGGVTLSLDTEEGWGDESAARAQKQAEADAWDEAETLTQAPAATAPENEATPETTAAIDTTDSAQVDPKQAAVKAAEDKTAESPSTETPDVNLLALASPSTVTPRETESISVTTVADTTATNKEVEKPAPILANAMIDQPMSAQHQHTPTPDKPVFELNPPVFAQRETLEKPLIALVEENISTAIPVVNNTPPENMDSDASPTATENDENYLDNSKVMLTADLAKAIEQGLEDKISTAEHVLTPKKIFNQPQTNIELLSADNSDNKALDVPANPVDFEPVYTPKPDASHLLSALSGSGQLAHLQTRATQETTALPAPEPASNTGTETLEPETAPISPPEPVVEKLTWQCYRSGFFEQAAAAKAALRWWQAKTPRVELIETQKKQATGKIQLYLPAFANKREAVLAMAHLKQVGIGHFLMDDPKYAIAVGTFSKLENAQKQRKRLAKFGYRQVKTKSKSKQQSRYHLRLQLNQQQDDWLEQFTQTQQVLRPEKTRLCPQWRAEK